MEKIFVDTSAMFALVNTAEANNLAAWDIWNGFGDNDVDLISNNYVIVESISLIQGRLGLSVMRKLLDNVLPFIQVIWVDEDQHSAIVQDVLSANRRNLSLVDCSAFATMRREGIETVFTFDAHFREQGFRVIP
ncbi:MAG: PIN domain-containing protein [Chloroflexota bacterium]